MIIVRVDTVSRGNAAEAAVLSALASAAVPVLLPFGGGLPFDLAAVAPSDGAIVRVQVKCGRIRKGGVAFNTCSTDHGRGRQSYRERADVIAVHVAQTGRIYVVPVEECPAYVALLRLDRPRNNQQRGIRLAEDYAFDRWVEELAHASAQLDTAG